jgi:hypothetical protein
MQNSYQNGIKLLELVKFQSNGPHGKGNSKAYINLLKPERLNPNKMSEKTQKTGEAIPDWIHYESRTKILYSSIYHIFLPPFGQYV